MRRGRPRQTVLGVVRSFSARAGFGARPPTWQPGDVWQPVALFAGICTVLLVLAFGLVGRHIGTATVTRHAVLTLAIVLLLDMLLVTGALWLASNDTGRTLALGAGGICALVGATFVLGGAPLGLGTGVICLALVSVGARQSVHSVEDGSVLVTALPGGRHRTLSPGFNLLLPGERVLAMLSTRPRSHRTLPERASLPNGMDAEAALTIQYALLAERAERAVATARDWERALRGRTRTILREELGDFLAASAPLDGHTGEQAPALPAAPDSPTGGTTSAASDELRARLHSRLRHEFAAQGVEVLAVEVHDVTLPVAVLTFWHNAPTAAREEAGKAAREATRDDGMRPAHALPADTAPQARGAVPVVPALAPTIAGAMTRAAAVGKQPGRGAQAYVNGLQERLGELLRGWRRFVRPGEAGANEPDAPASAHTTAPARDDASAPRDTPGARTLSARTLAAMYEAVQEERISDPETIRHVAEALRQYAPAGEEDDELPFDPQTAATDLLSRLAQQAQPADVDATAADDLTRNSVAGEGRSGWRTPSDENILRGG